MFGISTSGIPTRTRCSGARAAERELGEEGALWVPGKEVAVIWSSRAGDLRSEGGDRWRGAREEEAGLRTPQKTC